MQDIVHWNELIAKYRKPLLRENLLLVFTTLVCLDIKEIGHAEAVNTNLSNQLKRGNFEIASNILCFLHTVIFKRAARCFYGY